MHASCLEIFLFFILNIESAACYKKCYIINALTLLVIKLNLIFYTFFS